MGFLDRLRASEKKAIDSWKMLTELSQLDEIDRLSNDKTVVIFKHSTSCGISAGAKFRLESEWSSVEGEADFYYLDLIAYRNISNEIASRYMVRHESPQIVVIKKGKAIFDTSHHKINVVNIKPVLA